MKLDSKKHPNGGGLVADTAHVDAIVYANARVDGKTHICGCSLVYYTKQYILLYLNSFKCYGPFSDPSEMSLVPGVNYRIIELEN